MDNKSPHTPELTTSKVDISKNSHAVKTAILKVMCFILDFIFSLSDAFLCTYPLSKQKKLWQSKSRSQLFLYPYHNQSLLHSVIPHPLIVILSCSLFYMRFLFSKQVIPMLRKFINMFHYNCQWIWPLRLWVVSSNDIRQQTLNKIPSPTSVCSYIWHILNLE